MTARDAAMALLWAFLGCWATWVFFGCIMSLKRVRAAGELTLPAMVLGVPTLVLGALLDLALNLTVGTVLFLELPREGFLSNRLRRLVHTQPTTWRGQLALWLRRSLLDNIDPDGIHLP